MVRALQQHGVEAGSARASARHAIRTALGLADVAAEEIRPQYMRGYGAMSDEALPELHGLATELQGMIRRLDALLVTADREAGESPRALSGAPKALARVAPAPEDSAPVEAELRRAASYFEDVRKVCEAQRDPPQLVLTEALDLAAERAGTALDHPHSMPGGVNAAVRTAITQVAADNADDVRRPLGVLVEQVRSSLAAAAQAAGLADAGPPDEWSRLMRAMPAFSMDAVELDVRMGFRKALGKGVAHARMRKAIADQIGPRVASALGAHALALHGWSMGVWSRVQDDFNARAEAIRSSLRESRG
jgi:hypothetical protein